MHAATAGSLPAGQHPQPCEIDRFRPSVSYGSNDTSRMRAHKRLVCRFRQPRPSLLFDASALQPLAATPAPERIAQSSARAACGHFLAPLRRRWTIVRPGKACIIEPCTDCCWCFGQPMPRRRSGKHDPSDRYVCRCTTKARRATRRTPSPATAAPATIDGNASTSWKDEARAGRTRVAWRPCSATRRCSCWAIA